MKEVKFKTNIKCTGCLAKVTPHMQELTELEEWNVDIYNPHKILTVKGPEGFESDVIDAVKAAGFNAEEIK